MASRSPRLKYDFLIIINIQIVKSTKNIGTSGYSYYYVIESRVCTTKHCSLMVTQYLLLITNSIPLNPLNHFRPRIVWIWYMFQLKMIGFSNICMFNFILKKQNTTNGSTTNYNFSSQLLLLVYWTS